MAIDEKNWTLYLAGAALTAGLIISSINQTWDTFLIAGGCSAMLFMAVKHLFGAKFRLYHAGFLGILASMIMFQANGSMAVQMILFPLIACLVLFKSWKAYIPFTAILFSAILFLGIAQHNGSQSFVLVEAAASPLKAAALYVAILLIFTALCGFLAEYINFITTRARRLETTLEELRQYEEANVEFAKQISSGNFEVNYTVREGDTLGKSLVEMSANLKAAALAEKQRNWGVEGIALIANILRLDHENIEELAYDIISNLVKYLKANQGGIFILNDDENEPALELKGCYAYERRKYIQKKLMVGEGLVGQAFLEKEPIYMTKVPDNYVRITSGLGNANPRSVMIVPLKVEDQVIGVIELASFQEFQPHEREFLEKASENIASAIISSKVKDRTAKLLKESQELTEEMRAQEEEMRQNMEELQATQENLQRESREREISQRENEKTKDFLQRIINAIPDPISVKECKEHRFLMVNKAWVDTYANGQDVIGKNDFDLFPAELAKKFYEDEEKIISEKSELTVEEKGVRNGQEIWNLTKKRVIENGDGEMFLVSMNTEITELKKTEQNYRKEKCLLDSLMNGMAENIYFKDLESKFIRVSNNMLAAFKAERQEQVVGKSDFDFFTEEHARPAYEAEQEIIRTGKPILNLIEKETYEDGRVAYVSTSKMPLRDEDGTIIGTFGISRDVTTVKTEKDDLEQKAKWLETLFKYIGQPVLILDAGNLCKFVSPNFAETLGFDKEEIEGQNILGYVHAEFHKAYQGAIKEARSKGQSSVELSLRTSKRKTQKAKASFINALKDEAVNGFICKFEF